MAFSLGIVGASSFGAQFASLFKLHPGVSSVFVTDLDRGRAERMNSDLRLDGIYEDFEALLSSPVNAVAIFTQRWSHGPLVVQALRAGKHVYSAVPMAISEEEVEAILRAVRETGLTYMMGETSFYNPASVYARHMLADGKFGRIFYTEGDYVHDMDLGFYDAYKVSGGENWKATASFPPMLYATHAVGGVLSVIPSHAVSVSCIGIRDQSNDGVFDREVSMFDNDISNATALFEMSDGGVMRINEMRRVGYPSEIRESRFRFFGTEASFEQIAQVSVWQDKHEVHDVSDELETTSTIDKDDPILANISPTLRESFTSGYARVHDVGRLPKEFEGAHNGHEGSHHFLVDDFVRAVNDHEMPAVNAWVAARYTMPGIVAHKSSVQGGARIDIPDFGSGPSLAP